MKVDFLIIGQGLAGSLFALHAIERGKRVLVVDRDEAETSSKVAAGLVTPIAGGRFHLPTSLPERLAYASLWYERHEEALKASFYHPTPIARLFQHEDEAQRWHNKLHDPKEAAKLEGFWKPLPSSYNESSQIVRKHGGFLMQRGGWMDIPTFLNATQRFLLRSLSYAISEFDSNELELTSLGARWQNVETTQVVFAQGWQGNDSPFFDWLPMNAAKGEILELSAPCLKPDDTIINSGGWAIPTRNGRWRVGSTYDHNFEHTSTTETGRLAVLQKFHSMVDTDFATVSHRAGIRPIIKRSNPFIGRHPKHPQLALLNGFGSKGVINGPWFAKLLLSHLLDGESIPRDNDLSILL